MLAKLKSLPLKVLLAFAILLAMLVTVMVLIPHAAIAVGIACVLYWCINTLAEHYIQ
jgi:hypothetical protein